MHVSTGPLLWLFVLTQTSLAIGPTAHAVIGKKKVLTVGYLTAIKGELKDRQGLAVSGAVTMALNEINSSPDILPNVTLALRWNDTRGDTVQATRALTEMLCDGVSALFGPEGPCHVEAIVAQARNIPMISYKCSDYKASLVPTFARTEPPDTQVTKSVISLLRYYNWHKFSVIHEHPWENVAQSLEEQAKTSNLTINHMIAVQDPHICCEKNLPCCQSGYWYQVIQDTKDRTRIYVFLGTSKALVDMMNTMESAQLFENGEYMVIFVDMMTYSPREAKNYLWSSEQLLKKASCYEEQGFQKRAKSLLVVVSTPPTKNYESFTEKVREFNAKDPFNFSTPTLFEQKNYIQFVSIYAAYLYDSVKLYARALNDLLSRHPVVTDEIIDEVASNGTEIIKTIVNYGTYISVTGATIRLDKNGDSEGNFSVLALKPFNLTLRDGGTNFTCDHSMIPVGYFLSTHTGGASDSYPAYQINRRLLVDWPNGVRPEDEPSCGFLNEQCPKDDSHVNSLVAAGALAVTLFCTSVIIMSIYRKWKIEQEIEGLLWMIDIHEIHGYFGNDIVSSPSKLSLASAASFGSRCSNQLFTATAKFRGVVVRIGQWSGCFLKMDVDKENDHLNILLNC
ncbi:receptor-type guanylate cyclase Gyc76C-like [Ctenocephalides felis]|uniref:receptor-type guanylate cyclase Gyc76C-like n=1 Tax=Ctenocephalides felis TaxID=7515 RepID=UPI000E6E24E4|nr:receptor-type guanylate cyclase Gyc76C-like [Ctenocephalides felis]